MQCSERIPICELFHYFFISWCYKYFPRLWGTGTSDAIFVLHVYRHKKIIGDNVKSTKWISHKLNICNFIYTKGPIQTWDGGIKGCTGKIRINSTFIVKDEWFVNSIFVLH